VGCGEPSFEGKPRKNWLGKLGEEVARRNIKEAYRLQTERIAELKNRENHHDTRQLLEKKINLLGYSFDF